MTPTRSNLAIMCDILKACYNPIVPTRAMYQSFTGHVYFQKYMKIALERGLLKKVRCNHRNGRTKFLLCITVEGHEYIKKAAEVMFTL